MIPLNCRVELSTGELRVMAPNLNYLMEVLVAMAPGEVTGTLTLSLTVAGVRPEFSGNRALAGLVVHGETMPRWMFAESGFRELIVRRAEQFVGLLKRLHADVTRNPTEQGCSEEWAAG